LRRKASTTAARLRRLLLGTSLCCIATAFVGGGWSNNHPLPARADFASLPTFAPPPWGSVMPSRLEVDLADTAMAATPEAPAIAPAEAEVATDALAQIAPAASAPPAEPTEPAPSTLTQTVEVEKGDTLIDLLTRNGIGRTEAVGAISALEEVFAPRDLMPGQEITLNFNRSDSGQQDDAQTQLASLSLQPSVERDVLVKRSEDGSFVAEAIARPLTQHTVLAGATIDSSLFEAGAAAEVPIPVLSEVIKAFSYDVDFQREIQPGDSFQVIYERYEDADGNLARTGDVLYAALTQSGVIKEIFRFEPKDGVVDFFTGKGESVRKALLRTPLDVIRITSKFGLRRHPILGYSRMHKGVDFAGAVGTPIFAAGDGVIAQIGKNRGYGNYVRIKHNSQYATAYGHMSRFAKGLKQGSKVRQGDVIGFVGATGLATGPHLHYEVLVNGAQINPMNVKLAAGTKLEGKELKRFEAQKQQLEALREKLGDAVLVAKRQDRCPTEGPSGSC
jgi:murein DD-endopeptidase MepM/ murein hydrolase activator NlpD